MAVTRARLPRSLRRAAGDERGFETAETMLVLPFLLVLIITIVQGAIWFHGTNLTQAAASNAYEAARLYDASSADGVAAGEATADQVGSILTDVRVNVTRSTTEVIATVTATTPGLLPGVNTTVTKTVTGPVERWTP